MSVTRHVRYFRWPECLGCGQSCTGSYDGTPGCTRCGWYLGKRRPQDVLEDEFQSILAEKKAFFADVRGGYLPGRPGQLQAARARQRDTAENAA